MSEPAFKLFRATGPTTRGVTHIGSMRCPHCERHSLIEARVVEQPGVARHFEGDVIAQNVREAKPREPRPQMTAQSQLELQAPVFDFNDPLPEA